MIKSEKYGSGDRWHCTDCDIRQGEKLPTISWTNSKPPEFCTRCVAKALAHYKTKLAEETERWGVKAVASDFVAHNARVFTNTLLFDDLALQLGLRAVDGLHDTQVVWVILSENDVVRPSQYYLLWAIVQDLEGNVLDDGEKAEAIDYYEGPYMLNLSILG